MRFSMGRVSEPRLWTFLGPLLLLLNGCQTAAPLPPVNLSEPGWKVRQGQALWKSGRDAPEIAGEILMASHSDGRGWIQFIKTPLPLVTAQLTAGKWQIEFIPQKRIYAGNDEPPVRFLWLQLLRALHGVTPPPSLHFHQGRNGSWLLENTTNGEILSGYLNP
jgi:hypothetical protein